MEFKSLSKLLVLIIFLGLLQGNIFAQDIQLPLTADSIACDTFPPPRNLDGIAYDHTIHLWWEKPEIDSITPNNLIGFNLFLNGEFIDSIPHTGEDTIHYFHYLGCSYPSPYNYWVTALYDMEDCGFPGIIMESEPSPMFSVGGPLGYGIPFLEYWNYGFSGDEYFWYAGDFWSIDEQIGNPYPSATYTGDTGNINYSDTLTCWFIDCRNHHWSMDPYVDGDFHLTFDIRLEDNSMSSTEKFRLEITDSIVWQTLTEYTNADGSFGWITKRLNISHIAKGENIRIAFIAEGSNASLINGWYLDNIKIYRQCNPPLDLHWEIIDEVLSWSPPLPHWPDKTNLVKGLQGYDIYYNYTLLGSTTDTFFILNTPMGYGPYYVRAIYSDCEEESNPLFGPQGLEDITDGEEIKIYPNPCHQKLSIRSQEPIKQVHLINSKGEIVLKKKADGRELKLNTSLYPNGIYSLKIQSISSTTTTKVIICH